MGSHKLDWNFEGNLSENLGELEEKFAENFKMKRLKWKLSVLLRISTIQGSERNEIFRFKTLLMPGQRNKSEI